jgi:hypothetical protein
MIFVSAPYSSPYNEIIKKRVKVVSLYSGDLLKKDIMCIAPILIGNTILNECNLPKDFGFWDKLSYAYLDQATEMHVLLMKGWDYSRGVTGEIEFAKRKNIPIKYINYSIIDGIPYFNEDYEIAKEEKKATKMRLVLYKEDSNPMAREINLEN